jgi:predicted nucleotidyltransferase
LKRLTECRTALQEDKFLLIRCRSAIHKIDPSAEVILYGSRARGQASRESDYDLLVLTDGEVPLKREDLFRTKLFPIELETGAVITVFLIGPEDQQ